MSISPVEDTKPSNPSISSASHLLIAILDQQLAVWHIEPAAAARRLRVEAEEWLRVDSPENLVNALTDLQSRLQSDGLTDWMLHLIVDNPSRSLLREGFPSMAFFFQQPWQLHDWAWLQIRLGLPTGANLWQDESLIGSRVLPWLTAERDEAYRLQLHKEFEDKMRAQAEQQAKEFAGLQIDLGNRHAQERETLKQEIGLLQTQNVELQERHARELADFENEVEQLRVKNTKSAKKYADHLVKLEENSARLKAQNAELQKQLLEAEKVKNTANLGAFGGFGQILMNEMKKNR